MRLAIVASHPIQYHSPLFRELAGRCDVQVFYAHRATPEQQAAAGFGQAFDWDVDLTEGYAHSFLRNVAANPGGDGFGAYDTPELGDLIANGRFDAVLVPGWGVKSYWQALLAARRAGVPVMVRGDSQLDTPRSALRRLAKRALYPPLLRLFDAALYVGTRSRAYYEHYGFPADRLFHSPHCIDTAWFAERATAEARSAQRAELSATDQDYVVLFAGKLQGIKRPLDVVETCARLGDPRVRIAVAGSGELAEAMAARARQAGVRLDMLGFRNQSLMPAAYAGADLLMLPSESETWGLVCNEALACARPILVSQACGCAIDLAGDRTAGEIYPTGDVGQASLKLAELINRPKAHAAIAQKSAAHSLAAAADGVLDALAFVSRGKRVGRSAEAR
jgi:glycosyltransferase involved in cell wall biosynthesis